MLLLVIVLVFTYVWEIAFQSSIIYVITDASVIKQGIF